MFGFLAFAVFEPMSILPYWARTFRIYRIYKAQQYYFETKKKPEEETFKWLKEGQMLKISAIGVAALFAVSIVFIVIYAVSSEKYALQAFYYLPTYSLTVCFLHGMCTRNTDAAAAMNTHINAAITWLLVINFLGNVFFLTCIYKLRNIKKEFNIRTELMVTFLAWFLCT